MTRALVISNGRLYLNFDGGMNIRDLYFPYVGQWNHVGGHKCCFGFWAENSFAWCDDPGWHYEAAYKKTSLISQVTGWHENLGLTVEMNDAVHYQDAIYLKRLNVRNPYNYRRTVFAFFNHDFSIEGNEVGDTAVYDPELQAVYHYKHNFYILANGRGDNGGIYQFSTGIKRFGGAEGTWRDAEDGTLECNPIAQGSVDSTISFRLELPPNSSRTIYYWLTCGRNYQEIRHLNQYVLDQTPAVLLRRTETYWRNWFRQAEKPGPCLPEEVSSLYYKSLLMVKAHMDRQGAIVAAADSDIMQFNRDHYAYAWPRDAALIARSMIRANYAESTQSFFRFFANALTNRGYLLPKYNPDGTAGSNWHPWYLAGQKTLPIQEDETALVLVALWQYFRRKRDMEFLQSFYRTLVEPAAEFMSSYIHEELDLPLESYDLWEEKRGIWTFTSSAVYAALLASSRMARLFADDRQAGRYRNAAARIRGGILKNLYDETRKFFVKGLTIHPDGGVKAESTLDSSSLGVFLFGVIPPRDPRMINTVKNLEETIWCKTPVGGMARYADDHYFRSNEGTGNPWIISTMWLAQWYTAIARSPGDLAKPLALLRWAAERASSAGLLPEQVDLKTGVHLSVVPLTWSHAAFIETVLSYTGMHRVLSQEPAGGRKFKAAGCQDPVMDHPA